METIGRDPALDSLASPPPALTPSELAAAEAAAKAALGTAGGTTPPSRAEALKKIADLKADPKYLERRNAGNVEALKEWRDLHKIAHALPDANESQLLLSEMVASQTRFGFPDPASDLGKDLLGYLSGQKSITPTDRRQVLARKEALFSDKGWTEKFLSGDLEARKTMRVITTLLTCKVKEAA